MNHLEVFQQEQHATPSEQRWLYWANAAEKALGHSLDGDLLIDGYCLDRAYGWFCTGADFLEYVQQVRLNKAEIAAKTN